MVWKGIFIFGFPIIVAALQNTTEDPFIIVTEDEPNNDTRRIWTVSSFKFPDIEIFVDDEDSVLINVKCPDIEIFVVDEDSVLINVGPHDTGFASVWDNVGPHDTGFASVWDNVGPHDTGFASVWDNVKFPDIEIFVDDEDSVFINVGPHDTGFASVWDNVGPHDTGFAFVLDNVGPHDTGFASVWDNVQIPDIMITVHDDVDSLLINVGDHPEMAKGTHAIANMQIARRKFILANVKSRFTFYYGSHYYVIYEEDYQMLMFNISYKHQSNQILQESNLKYKPPCYYSEKIDIYNRDILLNERKIQKSMETLHGIESTALLATFILAALAIRIVSEEEIMKDTLTHSPIVQITTKEVRQNLPRRAEEEASRQCGFCINHNQAIAYCKTCKLNICMPCKNTHKKVWTYINHTVCLFDEM